MLTTDMAFIFAHSDQINRRQLRLIRGSNVPGDVSRSHFTRDYSRGRAQDKHVRDFFLPAPVHIHNLQLPRFDIGGGGVNTPLGGQRQLFESQMLVMRQKYHLQTDLMRRLSHGGAGDCGVHAR